MDLYGEFIAWVNFAKAELVQAEIAESTAENDLHLREAAALIGQWSADAKGDRVTLAKARRDVDQNVMEGREEHLRAKSYRKLVEAMFDRCERCSQLLSRELSRRIGMAPKERMSGRFSA